MKKILLMSLYLFLISNIMAQQYVIEPLDVGISETVTKKLKSKKGVTKYILCKFNESLLNQEIVTIKLFDNREIVVKKRYLDLRSTNNYSWYGKGIDGITDVIFSIVGGTLTGMITNNVENYFIDQYKSELVLTKFDQSLIDIPECTIYEDNPNTGAIKPNIIPDSSANHNNDNKLKGLKRYDYNSQVSGNFKCKLRIMVLYTPTAENDNANILGTAQLGVDQLNTAFMNSDINYMAELACAIYTGDEPSSRSPREIIDNIIDPTDGRFDEFETKRKACGADIGVLLCDYMRGVRGVSAGIKVCKNRNFVAVDHDFATTTFTMAHEIGHQFGCRHTLSQNPVVVPYEYGHGICHEDNNHDEKRFYTMMSTSECILTTNRILYFSNPLVNYDFGDGTGYSTGGVVWANNARVIRENIENVMTFRNYTGSRLVNGTDIDTNTSIIYHPYEIYTEGTVNIPNNSPKGFMAGHIININEGFATDDDAEMVLELVNACGAPDNLPCNYDTAIAGDSILSDRIVNNIKELISIYPNPTNSEINISTQLGIESIQILDIEGRKILEIIKPKNPNFVELELKNLASGNYIIKVLHTNNTYQYKKISKL